MEKQPTAILLLFTDYLDNRDSIALFRLSSSVWTSHRSPQGRYRLKTIEGGNFPRPSLIPASFHFPLASPFSCHFLFDFLVIDDFSDFRAFFTAEESKRAEEEIPTIFRKIRSIAIHQQCIRPIIENKGKIPPTIEKLIFHSHGGTAGALEFQKIQEIFPMGIQCLDFSRILYPQFTNMEMMDFSCFHSLEELRMWPNCEVLMNRDIFPPDLRKLYLGHFKQILNDLPDSIEELYFGDGSSWNHTMPSQLPRNLKILHLSFSYNSPIVDFPLGLKSLKFSQVYNHPLSQGIFPEGIEEIIINSSFFNHLLVSGLFPNSLTSLEFCCSRYSNPLPSDLLPESLQTLKLLLKPDYPHSIHSLPSGLKSLTIGGFFDPLNSPNFLPPRLESIHFSSYNRPLPVGIFPASLKEIDFSSDYNQPLEMGIFPIGLKKIRFGKAFNFEFSIGIFPPSIEEIEFSYNSEFNHSLSLGIFSVGLKKIIFGDSFDKELPVGIFPPGILTIELGNRYSHPLEAGLFPSSVRKLKISTAHPLPIGVFPDGVESIEFCKGFSQPLLPGIFPVSLRILKFLNFPPFVLNVLSILPGVLPPMLCNLDMGMMYAGDFPSSSLSPYFLSDFPCFSSKPRRLQAVPFHPPLILTEVEKFINRIGRNRHFLQKTLRAPVSSSPDYFLISPADGVGDDFVVSKHFIAMDQEN